MPMSEMFWTFVITSGVGLIITLTKMGYKSKCKEFECCCMKVVRDTVTEEKELEFQVKNGLPPIIRTPSLTTNPTTPSTRIPKGSINV